MGPRASTDSVISSIAKYLPMQMAERYLSQNGFVKYLINNSGNSYVKNDGGMQTLKNMTKKNKNKFNAEFSPISHHYPERRRIWVLFGPQQDVL